MYLRLATVVIVMLQYLLNTLFGEQTSSVPRYTLEKGIFNQAGIQAS